MAAIAWGDAMNELEWRLLEDKAPLESIRLSDQTELRKGGRVRLRPRPGGDVMDLALSGKLAVIESLEQDYEGSVQVSVVLDDDPGSDIGHMRQPGHRFFFRTEEVEALADFETHAAVPRILVAGGGRVCFSGRGGGAGRGRRASPHTL